MTAEREGLTEEIAVVLACTSRCYPATRNGLHSRTCVTTRVAQAERIADALADLLAARDRRVRAEAVREYRDALAGNESAENWMTRDDYLHDLADWATHVEEAGA